MTIFFVFFACTGWTLALVLALGWWLSKRYDDQQRQLVEGINQVAFRVAQLEKQNT